MKNLENYGVQELNSEEKISIDGGKFWGKVYSNPRMEGGFWVHDVAVYRFGIRMNSFTERFIPGHFNINLKTT